MSEVELTRGEQRAAWRRQVVEEVLWPEQRLCDAHHHLWHHEQERYLAAEFLADITDGHNVRQTIYAECIEGYRTDGPEELRPLGETEFVLAQDETLARALGRPVITGIVGHADLCLGSRVRAVLEAQVALRAGRFRGVRHATAHDPSPAIVAHQAGPPAGLMADADFIDGVRTLGAMGLTYDAWLYHPQIPELIALARAVPETVIVLDHLGAPVGIGPYAGQREAILAYCREQLAELAGLPNVRLKLGGIGMTLYGNGWHRREQPPGSVEIAADWGDHIRWCIDTFGPERAMFESNFPPDGRSVSYRTLWNAFKRIAEPYSQAERDRLFHDSAIEIYSVPRAAP